MTEMVDVDLDALPLVDYWGARNIDRAINVQSLGGAAVAFIAIRPLGRVVAVATRAGRDLGGWVGANVAWALAWFAMAYFVLIVVANYKRWTDGGEDS